jgi:hypothetical protein
MSADIPSVDSNPEVVRLGRLIETYRARISELSAQRDRLVMQDEATNVVGRAEALASGGAYQPVRTADQIDDELSVLRGAIRRIDAQAIDARAMATIRITHDARLHERAAELRSAVAAGIDGLMAALHEAEQFADHLNQASISATGARWPGCGDDRLQSLLAGLRLDLGVATDKGHELERRAGRRGEAMIELQARPAPAVAKSVRRKIVDAVGEMLG